MQQSNVIFGVLTLAFIIYITLRGELSAYLSLLRGSGSQSSNSAASASGAGGASLDNIAQSAISTFEKSFATSAGITPPAPASYTNANGTINPALAVQYLYGAP